MNDLIKRLLPIFIILMSATAHSQCPQPITPWGMGPAPLAGNSAIIEVCCLVGEYATVDSVVASNTYSVNYSGGPGVYIVIYDGSNTPIAWGDSTVQFTASQSGTYYTAAFIDSSCDDFDATFTCNTATWTNTTQNSGLASLNSSNASIFPNPTNELVTLTFEGNYADVVMSDLHGKMIFSDHLQSGDKIDLSEFDAGIYFFHLTIAGRNDVLRVVRQ